MKHLTIAIWLFAFYFSLVTTCLASDWDAYQKSGHRSPKWDSFVETGFSSFESGNFGSAELLLQRAIARGCNDGLVYAKIGLYYESAQNYKKAADYFQKAEKKLPFQYPNHEITLSIDEFMGRVLFLSGENNKALVYLDKAFKKRNSFTSAYFLGLAYKAMGDIDNALLYLEKAITLPAPKETSASVGILIMSELGKAYFDKKDLNRSLEWWNKILSIDPMDQTARSYKQEIERQMFKEKEKKVIEEIIK